MKINTLEEAFIHGLSDIYNAEKQLVRAIPKLVKAASNAKLAESLENHLAETQEQVERIDQIVEETGVTLHNMKCKAMEGLVEESSEIIKEIKEGPIRDVMLIVGAQKIKHYEIATYGGLVEIAKQLDYSKKATDLLADTLEEEKTVDETLTNLAISDVNEKAFKSVA